VSSFSIGGNYEAPKPQAPRQKVQPQKSGWSIGGDEPEPAPQQRATNRQQREPAHSPVKKNGQLLGDHLKTEIAIGQSKYSQQSGAKENKTSYASSGQFGQERHNAAPVTGSKQSTRVMHCPGGASSIVIG